MNEALDVFEKKQQSVELVEKWVEEEGIPLSALMKMLLFLNLEDPEDTKEKLSVFSAVIEEHFWGEVRRMFKNGELVFQLS